MDLTSCYCGNSIRPFATGPYYVCGEDGQRKTLSTVLYYCPRCDLEIRDVDYNQPMIASHYNMASYTDLGQEDRLRQSRMSFFDWFYRLAVRHLPEIPTSVLDYGCSYGHLLDRFAQGGAKTVGVEIVEKLVEQLRRQGRHRVHRNIDEVADGSMDVVTAIDSLYCTEGDPAALLAALAAKLRPGGLLITRTTNRNQTHRLMAWWWRRTRGAKGQLWPASYKVCGDAKHGFSEKALVGRYAQAGLEKVSAYRLERKEKTLKESVRDFSVWVAYCASLGCLDFCPGLVLLARKRAAG